MQLSIIGVTTVLIMVGVQGKMFTYVFGICSPTDKVRNYNLCPVDRDEHNQLTPVNQVTPARSLLILSLNISGCD